MEIKRKITFGAINLTKIDAFSGLRIKFDFVSSNCGNIVKRIKKKTLNEENIAVCCKEEDTGI